MENHHNPTDITTHPWEEIAAALNKEIESESEKEPENKPDKEEEKLGEGVLVELGGMVRLKPPINKCAQEQLLDTDQQLKMAEDTIMNVTERTGRSLPRRSSRIKKKPASFMAPIQMILHGGSGQLASVSPGVTQNSKA